MGASFLEVDYVEDGEGAGGYAKVMSKGFIEAEMLLFKQQCEECDIVITTAAIPGRRAPLLIKRYHVEALKTGSVIVDLAALTGGNCELTKLNEVVNYNGVFIVGYGNLPARMARQSSQMYAMNMFRLMEHMGEAKEYKVDMEDQVIRPMMVCHDGANVYEPPKPPAAAKPKRRSSAALRRGSITTITKAVEAGEGSTAFSRIVSVIVLSAVCVSIALFFPESFSKHLMVFALSCVVGYNSIWNVTSSLHTPLMSVTNAISGVVMLGGMVQVVGELDSVANLLGAFAVFIGAINIFGGFWVTQRMLNMFVIKK
jgi:NAD(P) transhydrogenase subunit alpha